MKYSLLALFCAVQLFQAPLAMARTGDAADIAKFSRYDNLRISGHLFYTTEIRKLYALRANRSVWFDNGRSNGRLEAYLNYVRRVYDAGQDNREIWIPLTRNFYSTADANTWVTLELVATHSLLTYLNSRGVSDYRDLNAVLSGSIQDFNYYLQHLRLQGTQVKPVPVTPPIQISPLPSVTPAPAVTAQGPATPIGTSNARYVTDPGNDDVNQFYQANNSSVWTDGYGRPNALAAALRDTLRSAGRHGLNPDDYWDANLESLYQNTQSGNGMLFETNATYALLRYVSHLNAGRVDPQQVDSKLFKFSTRKFSDYQTLALIVQGGAANLKNSLDAFAPQIPEYKGLMANITRLQNLKAQGAWKKIGQPAKAVQMGESNPVISSVRQQLANLGYQNVGSGNVYDADFDKLVQSYQAANGLPSKIDYRFWNSFYKSVDDSIQTVSVNMEKLRWVPRNSNNRFAFVNLAAQEIRLLDQNNTLMKFRTVNGRSDRPTPSMIQQTKRVILNPTWTVPPGLAIKDKLPLIRQDANYMTLHNMYVFDARANQYIMDVSKVNLNAFTDSNNTPYYLVQGPGNQNALGVLKFPLQNLDGSPNADDIYMHDTNERELFPETNRLRSSGCIRLQYPLEFAAELLKDKMSVDDIKARVPWDDPTQTVSVQQTNQSVSLSKPLIVYVMYLTSEQNDDGSVRIFDDAYGLDAKIVAALNASH